MSSELSFFDERRCVVTADFEWGQWWQTVHELHLKVKLEPGTKAKQINLVVKPKFINLDISGKNILKGPLARTVVADETLWTIEEGFLCIVLTNASHSVNEEIWESLLADRSYAGSPLVLHEMRKSLDLERFQLENPGFDFSRATLSKSYDKMPGWSHDRTQELRGKENQTTSDTCDTFQT